MARWSGLVVPAALFACWLAVQAAAGNLLTGIWHGFWQLLPLQPLIEAPLASILLLHSQPPVLNVLLWLVHAVATTFGLAPETVATVAYTAVSAASCLLWHHVFLRCSGSRIAAAALTAVYLFHPAFVHFQRIFFYQHLVQWEMALLVYAVARWAERPRLPRMLAVSAVLALIVHTRSLWHPVFGVLLLGAILAAARGSKGLGRGKGSHCAVAGMLFFACLVAPWMIKNHVLFGTASFSSWLGHNLGGLHAREFVENRTFDEALVTDYYGSERIAWMERQPVLALLDKDIYETFSHRANLNHYAVVPLNKYDVRRQLALYRSDPSSYLFRCYSHIVFFDLPHLVNPYAFRREEGTYGSEDMSKHGASIGLQRAYDTILYGSWFRGMVTLKWNDLTFRPSLWFLVFLPGAVAGCVLVLLRPKVPQDRILAVCLMVLFGWFLAMIVFVSGLESARMKWDVEGVVLAMGCLSVRRVVQPCGARTAPATSSARSTSGAGEGGAAADLQHLQ